MRCHVKDGENARKFEILTAGASRHSVAVLKISTLVGDDGHYTALSGWLGDVYF